MYLKKRMSNSLVDEPRIILRSRLPEENGVEIFQVFEIDAVGTAVDPATGDWRNTVGILVLLAVCIKRGVMAHGRFPRVGGRWEVR